MSRTEISKCHVLLGKHEIHLICAIIGIDEQRPPPWGQGLAVYTIAVVLCCNEGLARHHVQHWLVLASGETQIFIKHSLCFIMMLLYERQDLKTLPQFLFPQIFYEEP